MLKVPSHPLGQVWAIIKEGPVSLPPVVPAPTSALGMLTPDFRPQFTLIPSIPAPQTGVLTFLNVQGWILECTILIFFDCLLDHSELGCKKPPQ